MLGESIDAAAVSADLTAKGAAFVFRALAAWLAVVRGVGCDNELDGDGDDDGDDDQPLDFDASLGAIMIL